MKVTSDTTTFTRKDTGEEFYIDKDGNLSYKNPITSSYVRNDPTYADVTKELLNKVKNGEMSMEEFNQEWDSLR